MTAIMRILAASMLLTAAVGGLSAQTPAPTLTPTSPPVEATPDQPPLERDAEAPRTRYRRPVFRAAQDYVLPAGDAIRSVQTLFGDAEIAGRVEGDVVTIIGSARLASTAVVEGSLVVVGGGAVIDGGARVGRDLVIVGGTLEAPASFAPDGDHVVIGTPWLGEALEDLLPWITRGLLWGRLIVPGLDWVWIAVGVFFLLYLVLNTVLDRPVGATADVILERPVSAFVGGLVVLVLAVPVLAIVAASVIGLAIVPFLLCALVVAGLIGKTAVSRAIGRGIIRVEPPEGRVAAFFAFTIGSVLLLLAYMVPVLGFVAWALTSVLGLGAAAATFRAHLRRERQASRPAASTAAAIGASQAAEHAGTVEPGAVDTAQHPPVVPPEPPIELPPPPTFTHGFARYPRATFLDRLAAFVLDCVLVGIANGLIDSRNDGLFFILLLGYHIGFWIWKGTTLGGIIINLRVTRTDGTNLQPADAVVRGLSAIFSLAALGIGCLWMLQDPESQTWHDKIAGTLVVKVPRDVPLP